MSKALRNGLVLTSIDAWEELQEVLLRFKFERYQASEVRRRFLTELHPALEPISVHTILRVCRDRQDEKFLELAVDGQAGCIVTGDLDLLELHPFRGIEILTPKDFLDR